MGPFKEFNCAFDPAALAVLQDAFDAAWQDLRAAGKAIAADDVAMAAREELASRIMGSAAFGVLDPLELRKTALAGLIQPTANARS